MTKISQKIDEIFSNISELTDLALESDAPDQILVDSYTIMRERFKKLKGSGNNFTGLSEFFYFQYVLRYLEIKYKIQFEKQESKTVFYFKAKYGTKNFYLSSDIELIHFTEQLPYLETYYKKKPDIFIAIEDNDEFLPIAFIEVKANIDTNNIESEIINRFRNLKSLFEEANKMVPFFVFLDLYSNNSANRKELIKEFEDISDTCLKMLFVGNKWVEEGTRCEGTYNGSIFEIMEEITRNLL